MRYASRTGRKTRRPAVRPRSAPGAERPGGGLSFSDGAKVILAAPAPDGEVREALLALGLEPTVLNAILWGMIGKAARGDASAAKYLREMAEEEPSGEEPLPEPDWADLSALSDAELRALAARLEGAERR